MGNEVSVTVIRIPYSGDDKKIPAADAERDKMAAQLSPEQKTAAAAFEAEFKTKHANAPAG